MGTDVPRVPIVREGEKQVDTMFRGELDNLVQLLEAVGSFVDGELAVLVDMLEPCALGWYFCHI